MFESLSCGSCSGGVTLLVPFQLGRDASPVTGAVEEPAIENAGARRRHAEVAHEGAEDTVYTRSHRARGGVKRPLT